MMKRLALCFVATVGFFAAGVDHSSADARGPFSIFRRSTPRSTSRPQTNRPQPAQHSTQRPMQPRTQSNHLRTPRASHSPLGMTKEQLNKTYGPSILVREKAKARQASRFVSQPDEA